MPSDTLEDHSNWSTIIGQVLSHLECDSFVEVCEDDVLEKCGPFLRRLVEVADEARVNDLLDDLFNRVSTLFVPCMQAAAAASNSELSDTSVEEAQALIEHTATSAFNVLTTEVFSPLSSSGCSKAFSWERGLWCRLGTLLIRLLRAAADGPHALVLRLPWPGASRSSYAVLAPLTIVWGAVVRLLSLLVAGTDSNLPNVGETHTLLHIISDCVVVMMERCDFLRHEAGGRSASKEVLCVSFNSFVWIKDRCCRLPMSRKTEVLTLLDGYTADTLQDFLNNCATELQHILSMAASPPESWGDTKQQLATLVDSFSAVFRGIAPPLPQSKIASLLLDRALRPVVEDLLEGGKRRDFPSLSVVTRTLRTLTEVQRIGNGSVFLKDIAERVTGVRAEEIVDSSGVTASATHHMLWVLQLMEEKTVFGREGCHNSISFCTLRRLLSTSSS
uniref:Uncharacterized protein n=1 Tax=Trypanosoma congolense (strain IL3000) TaxID=1068625 RepID=G0UQ22_TRYCI|nr:conserved hypothetical protein [Trypanosoma congolense IL3000]